MGGPSEQKKCGRGVRKSYLEDVPPVLALIIQSLVQHFHYLYEFIPVGGRFSQLPGYSIMGEHELIKGHLGKLVHLGSTGTPRIV